MQDWLESFATTAFRRSADTAHDLKTPLNVAVLNLELLRMRLAKLIEGGDEKLTAYAASIDVELRRMARIVDSGKKVSKIRAIRRRATAMEAAYGVSFSSPPSLSCVSRMRRSPRLRTATLKRVCV